MRKTFGSFALGLAGVLSGCPSAPARDDEAANVAPVQSDDVAPVQSAVVQRSIEEETSALVDYLKQNVEKDKVFKGFSDTVFFGDRRVRVSWSEEESRWRSKGLTIWEDVEFNDTDCDGRYDSSHGAGLDGRVLVPSENSQKKFESLVRRIVEFCRQKEEWIESHSMPPAGRASQEEYAARARMVLEYAVQNGRRLSPEYISSYALYECKMNVDGCQYSVFVKKGSKSSQLTTLLIEKESPSGRVLGQFTDYDVEHGLYLSPLGVCDGAFVLPGLSWYRYEKRTKVETAIQLEYERTLDKLVDVIRR